MCLMQAISDDVSAALNSPRGSLASKYTLSVLHPSDVIFIASSITMTTLRTVSDCLKDIVVPASVGGAAVDRVVSLSYEQYVALLDAHVGDCRLYHYLQMLTGSSPSADIMHFDMPHSAGADSDSAGDRSLARKELLQLRCCGIRHRDVQFGSLFCHSMRATMHEMERQLDVVCPYNTYVNENSLNEEQAELQMAFLSSLELLHSYDHIREIRQSRQSSSPHHLFGGPSGEDEDEGGDEGDTLQALCFVDDAMAKLSEVLHGPVEEYVEEGGGGAGPPRMLRSELLIER